MMLTFDKDDDHAFNNVDIEQGVPKEVPNRITCTRFRTIATLKKSAVYCPSLGEGEHVDLFSVAIVRNCNPKKFLGAGDSIRNFFGASCTIQYSTVYIPSHCTPALLKA